MLSAFQSLAVSRSFIITSTQHASLSSRPPRCYLGLLCRTRYELFADIHSPLQRSQSHAVLARRTVLAELNITISGVNITAAAFLSTNDTVRTSAQVCFLVYIPLPLLKSAPLYPFPVQRFVQRRAERGHRTLYAAHRPEVALTYSNLRGPSLTTDLQRQ